MLLSYLPGRYLTGFSPQLKFFCHQFHFPDLHGFHDEFHDFIGYLVHFHTIHCPALGYHITSVLESIHPMMTFFCLALRSLFPCRIPSVLPEIVCGISSLILVVRIFLVTLEAVLFSMSLWIRVVFHLGILASSRLLLSSKASLSWMDRYLFKNRIHVCHHDLASSSLVLS